MDEDEAALLAELRAISNQAATSRFEEEEARPMSPWMKTLEQHAPVVSQNNAAQTEATPPVPKPETAPFQNFKEIETPEKQQPPRPLSIKTMEQHSPPSDGNQIVSAETTIPTEFHHGIKADRPTTFQGERGGAAEDAELLAELRAISNKSTSAARFVDTTGSDDTTPTTVKQTSITTAAEKKKENHNAAIPPWKRRGQAKSTNTDIDVVVAAPPAFQATNVPSNENRVRVDETNTNMSSLESRTNVETVGLGIKADRPTPFQGERGGAAEDAELLAELRAISNKSTSAARFVDTTGSDHGDSQVEESGKEENQVLRSMPSPIKAKARVGITPPWKRRSRPQSNETHPDFGVTDTTTESAAVVENVTTSSDINAIGNNENEHGMESQASNLAPHGIKSEIASTFSGERGGEAEDPELLALLRGISNKASSRFEDTDGPPTVMSHEKSEPKVAFPESSHPTVPVESHQKPPTDVVKGQNFVSAKDQVDVSEDLPLKLADLSYAWKDKNWKIRGKAYELLSQSIVDLADSEKVGSVNPNRIMEGLDNMIPEMLQDANASVLDSAIKFVLVYTEHCSSAGSAEQAGRIASALLSKNAFSSRPTTLQLADELVLKLIEVGSVENESVHKVIEILIDEGLSSKKPKVAVASSNLILKAALDFGATCLPLHSIVKISPKILNHANAAIRENHVKLVAEICRAFGSRAPIQNVIDGMKSAQAAELNNLLSNQPEAREPKRICRSQVIGTTSTSISVEDAMVAMKANVREEELKRFAARPAINLFAKLPQKEYAQKLALAKWSEKVEAMTMVIEAAGEKPFKLVDPSPVADYVTLISDMKKLLSHTHFAVCGKAMEVLSVLAEGVGEKLYQHLRPIVPQLLQLLKDKKLTRSVSACLDSFFGHVIGFDTLLDDDVIPCSVDEQKQKNALVRMSALDFISRCIKRDDISGPRGAMTTSIATRLVALGVSKLDDSDASVRKAAVNLVSIMHNLTEPEIRNVVSNAIDQLKNSNVRVYKTLMRSQSGVQNVIPSKSISSSTVQTTKSLVPSNPSDNTGKRQVASSDEDMNKENPILRSVDQKVKLTYYLPITDEAIAHVVSLGIPQWDEDEDNGGILAGLKSSKWSMRHDAIKSITAFVESGSMNKNPSVISTNSSSILVLVREHTRGFKETNVNIMKAVMELFIALCEYHNSCDHVFTDFVTQEGVEIAVQKISDRKLSDTSKSLLHAISTVSIPRDIFQKASEALNGIRSPVAHEEFLKWFKLFCDDFGANTIGSGLGDIVPWLLEESNTTNPKVKRAALSIFACFHAQFGPSFKALSLALAKNSSVKRELEKCYEENPFNPELQKIERPFKSVALAEKRAAAGSGNEISVEFPRLDLFHELSVDCISNMGQKDGKASWKMRKEALDELSSALNGCGGLLDTSSGKMKQLTELMKCLRDRLCDTQINLKPTAAQLCGVLLSLVDKDAQAKLGKVVYSSLISAAMNDIKKPMRDSCLDALRLGVTLSPLAGDGLNQDGLDNLMNAFVSEVTESSTRAGGLPEVLDLVRNFVTTLPNLDEVVSPRGQVLSESFSAVLVECLTSSKAETRASATLLLEKCMENKVISYESLKKAIEKLKPAKQRTVGPVVAKFSNSRTAESEKDVIDTSNNSAPKTTDTSLELSRQSHRQSSKSAQRNPPKISTMGSSTHAKTITKDNKRNPLLLKSGPSKRPTTSSIVWPEYPEEPNTTALLGNLKRTWAACLPETAVSALFPVAGINKQDDSSAGCDLIKRAIMSDLGEGTKITVDHLDAILKWISVVLSSRESTVGLQSLLSLVKLLFDFLSQIEYKLSDVEVMVLVPFLLEKASNSKGRFRDTYMELSAIIQSENFLPSKRLGGVLGAALLERSSHAKTRLLGYRICIDCVEKVGLVGIGKKGVISCAKLLSEETLPENKSSALELMLEILEKMGGDIQRLVRICGADLSGRGREILEEAFCKRRNESNALSPDSRTPKVSFSNAKSNKSQAGRKSTDNRITDLHDELPTLSLRDNGANLSTENSQELTRQRLFEQETISDPFSFSRQDNFVSSPHSTTNVALKDVIKEGDTDRVVQDSGDDENKIASELDGDRVSREKSEGTGAAANLRARLLKIRERSTVGESSESISSVVSDSKNGHLSPDEEFHNTIYSIKVLIRERDSISDDAQDMITCIESLKKFHAALAKQQNGNFYMSTESLIALRQKIGDNMNESIENLTSLIGFSLRCGEPQVNAGMSIPLLSVCLATLMALFRDVNLALKVSEDDMTLLIKETGSALLDSRLSSSSNLDESTSSQMVRAINKLAVQAATGAARHTSLQSLLTLQQQLLLELTTSSGDLAFNSRLSRVVSKLFARVVKAEELSDNPYSSDSMDMEALLCSLEDFLVACDNNQKKPSSQHGRPLESCYEMAKNLVTSIIKSQHGSQILHNQMKDLGIDLIDSSLGSMVAVCENELAELSQDYRSSTQETMAELDSPYPSSRDMATLVANIANSQQGPEREAAVNALKRYNSEYGNDELNEHLRHVSFAFRAFIEEQLGEDASSPEKVTSLVEATATSMSERLKSLRSRLQATELVVQSTVEHDTSKAAIDASKSFPGLNKSVTATSERSISNTVEVASLPSSRLAQPSPSKIAQTTGTSQTLHERLAATQEARRGVDTTSSFSGLGRAAALRARLEAVKNKKNQY